jgi:HTH-type transcriptional regulator/antitoxin HigA
MIGRIGKMTIGLKKSNDYYLNLVIEFPPRPITNEIEWRNIQQRINTILDKKNLTPEDRDYLRVLGMLVYDYEQKFEPMPKLENAELLEALMQDYDLKTQDFLAIFDTEEKILAILQNKRKMTIEEYQQLSSLYRF